MLAIPPEFAEAYREYEREIAIKKTRLGCFIGIVLVPMFSILDYHLYPDLAGSFLFIRLLCSVLMAALYPVLGTHIGRKYYHLQGVVLLFLPTASIAWMIYEIPDGASSPYYAGLNLVLMVLAVVLDWTFWQSVASVLLVLVLYVAATYSSALRSGHDFYLNNLFFLVSTGIAIVTGAYFHSKVRVSEFVFRCKLDKSTKELAETNQKLLELDEIKSRFFANISHELRTPLTLLLAPLETLLHRFGQSFDEQTRNMLRTMHSNGMRLLKLINDLLDLVRLESGKLEVKQDVVAVPDFIKGLASAVRQVAEDKRIQLATVVAPEIGAVVLDRDKLEKIVLNLMFNALKFTPSGGRVELRAERQEDKFVIVVSDTGMGISAKNLPFIFDRFWQADGSSKRKYQGVGIGLALVKELAEVQGGSVGVESEEGKGTTFRVLFPYRTAEGFVPVSAAKPDAPPAAAGGTVSSEEWLTNLYRRAELFPALGSGQRSLRPAETSGNGQMATLVVADDEPDMLRFLTSELGSNYRVIEAVDGVQAVEKTGQCRPALVLLDMMMPHKDGLQACREIRDHPETRSIPILLLTARADEETKLAALSAGASDFLTKPFSTTELQVRIKNLVESHHYQRKLARQNVVLEQTIDQLKLTETKLVQSEKLNSLTRWSAEIIHQMNNPLNYATMALESLGGKARHVTEGQRGEYNEILGDVRDGVQRLREIVAELKMFAHPETESRDMVEVSDLVNVALRFLRFELEEKVKVQVDIPEGMEIWGNRSLLTHVLMNLLQNSVDALKQKQYGANERPEIRIHGRVGDGKAVLVIRDNGVGISHEHKAKVFDPFFTTKDVGEGMGLGLAICYRIVQDSDGRIDFTSEPGRYCEFTLEFPAKG